MQRPSRGSLGVLERCHREEKTSTASLTIGEFAFIHSRILGSTLSARAPGGKTRGIRGDPHTPGVTETRRSFIRTRTQRAVVGRRVFPFLAFTTLTVALLAGFVVTIIDKEDFPNYGTAVWWAIVTLGTVGYGDVVPHTGWGRVVGSAVIIVGVTFIAFLTAVVTSLFVEEEQKTHRTLIEDAQRAYQDETRRRLEDVSSRLSTVETLLRDLQGQRR